MVDFLMDAHMHFDLYKKREMVLSYIEEHHSYTIAVTNLPELYERYYRRYNNFKFIKIALGFHPELAFQYKNQLPLFLKLIDTTRYIGEIGLDFTTTDPQNRQAQQEVLETIIKACTREKILSVHSRRAEVECIDILKRFDGKIIFHWYSGNRKLLKEAVDRGCYFSINQQMILSKNGRSIVDSIPIDHILIESDAPFTKGLENEYNFLFSEKVYKYLASTRSLTQKEVEIMIKDTFRKVLI